MEVYPEKDKDVVEFSDEVIDVATPGDGIDLMLDESAKELEEAEDDLITGFAEFEREGELIPDSVVDPESDNTNDIANNENEEGE